MKAATGVLRDVRNTLAQITPLEICETLSMSPTVIGRPMAPHPNWSQSGCDEWQSATRCMLDAFMLALAGRQVASRDRRECMAIDAESIACFISSETMKSQETPR